MNATPAPTKESRPVRPSEVNKLFTSLIFAALLAVAGYLVFTYSSVRSNVRAPALLTLGTFVLSFLFTTVFQAVRCPFNAVTVSIASGAVSLFILCIIALLSFPWTGPFLQSIVISAFPYIPDPTEPAEIIDPEYYTRKDKYEYSYAYAYWMFWGGLLPMYTILGFIRAC